MSKDAPIFSHLKEPQDKAIVRGKLEQEKRLPAGALSFIGMDAESALPIYTPTNPIVMVNTESLNERKQPLAAEAIDKLQLALRYLLSPHTSFRRKRAVSQLSLFAHQMMQNATILGTLCREAHPFVDLPVRLTDDGEFLMTLSTQVGKSSRPLQYVSLEEHDTSKYATARWDLPTVDILGDESSFDLTLCPPFTDSRPRTTRDIKFQTESVRALLSI